MIDPVRDFADGIRRVHFLNRDLGQKKRRRQIAVTELAQSFEQIDAVKPDIGIGAAWNERARGGRRAFFRGAVGQPAEAIFRDLLRNELDLPLNLESRPPERRHGRLDRHAIGDVLEDQAAFGAEGVGFIHNYPIREWRMASSE